MFLTKVEVLMGYKDTDQNINATSLTLIFVVGGHCVVDHDANTSQ